MNRKETNRQNTETIGVKAVLGTTDGLLDEFKAEMDKKGKQNIGSISK